MAKCKCVARTLTVLPQNGPEAERPYLGSQYCGCGGKHVVLNTDQTGRENGNDEKPQGYTIAIVAPLVRIEIGEPIQAFGENNTIGGINHATHYI
jgi:hypothetical protein